MPHYQIQWIKLERRLLNDYRFYTMTESAQLLYVKLLLMAAETANKIPKLATILTVALRLPYTESELDKLLQEIKAHFPKFREANEFYFFSEFGSKHNWVAPKSYRSSTKVFPDKIRIRKEQIRSIWDYFLEKTKRQFRLTPRVASLINNRLEKGYTDEQLRKAIDNFVQDDWPDRPKHMDLIYCFGEQRGKADALEKWLNFVPPRRAKIE